MRYPKLTLGVLLAIAGLVASTGAVFGAIWYFRNCVGASPGSLVSLVCQGSSAGRETVVWAIAALLLDADAVVVIRHRGETWCFTLTHAETPPPSERAR